jgi:hypothetical protein
MTRAADFISTSQAQKHQLIGRVDGLFGLGRGRVELSFGGHGERRLLL